MVLLTAESWERLMCNPVIGNTGVYDSLTVDPDSLKRFVNERGCCSLTEIVERGQPRLLGMPDSDFVWEHGEDRRKAILGRRERRVTARNNG